MSFILWKSYVEKGGSFQKDIRQSIDFKGKIYVDKSFQQGCGKLIGKLMFGGKNMSFQQKKVENFYC